MKRDAIEENHCLISSLPLMCLFFSAFWLRHCKSFFEWPVHQSFVATGQIFVFSYSYDHETAIQDRQISTLNACLYDKYHK